MLFIPYRMDTERTSLPIFTVLICAICMFVYWNQYTKDARHFNAVEQFCFGELDRSDASFLRHISHEESGNQCGEIFLSIRNAKDEKNKISELAKQARPMGVFASKEYDSSYIHSRLDKLYERYDLNVPPSLTDKLVYQPKNMNFLEMVTSTFSHGDVLHLLSNLLFFYIFAASVELVMGSMAYLLLISMATIGTSLAYSYSVIDVENAPASLGLSGVVMAAVAALAVMIPTAKIRCFFWLWVYVRIFKVPALILAVWYVGWDIYGMNKLIEDSNIDYVAHISGAAIGVLVGMFYSIFRKDVLTDAILKH